MSQERVKQKPAGRITLLPPSPEIPDDNPYANDLFERKEFGDSLTSLFRNLEEGVVVCIDASWGDGKTTFAEMWIADLKRQKIRCIYYDAYKHDYCDDPFVSFCAEIISLSKEAFDEHDQIPGLTEGFKTKAIQIGASLLNTGIRVGVRALTGGIVDGADFDELKSIGSDVVSGPLTAKSVFVKRALEDYDAAKKGFADFLEQLEELGGAVRNAQDFPLLIVVDELDRCRPDFALALIERIKHLFAAKNVSFLLLANMDQLENYVRTVYGSEVDARNYFQKFVTLSIELPKNTQDRYTNDYCKYSKRLIEHYGLPHKRGLDDLLPALFQHYRFSLREMERCFSVLGLYYSQLVKGRLTDPAVIPFLAIQKIRNPRVLSQLSVSALSYDSVVKETGIETLSRADVGDGWVRELLARLRFLLLSESEYETLAQDDPVRRHEGWLAPYHIERMSVMPFLCAELSKFKIEDAQGPDG